MGAWQLAAKHSFLKGVLVLSAAGIIVKFLGFLYRVVLTNLPGYGDEGNGIYGAGFQVYLVLYALSTTGFPSAIAKMVAEKTAVGDRRGAHRIFKVAFRFLSVTGLLISILFFACSELISRVISYPETVYTMIALSPTIFFVSLMAVFRGYFQGMQDMMPQASSQIVEQLGKTFFSIALACFLLPYGVKTAAAGATFGTTAGAAVGALYLLGLYNTRKRKLWANIRNFYKREKHEPAFRIVKNLIRISAPISIGAIVLTAANIIDLGTVMKLLAEAGFSSSDANRLYGILTGKCYVLTNFPVTISMALATSLVPAVAGAMAVKDYRTVSSKIIASLRLTILISLPSAAGLAVLAEPILKLLFPASSDGAHLLALSASAIIFMGLTQTLSGILQGMGRMFVPAASLLAGAAVKAAVNCLLMPLPNINVAGAVYGTLACYALSTVINIAALIRNFRLNLNVHNLIIKPVAATAVMGISVHYAYKWLLGLTGSNSVSAAISILLAAAVFGAAAAALGAVGAKDIPALPFGKNIGNMPRGTGL